MKQAIKNKYLQIIIALIGALGGFLYWRFIGCESGTCTIKSVWYWSTLWGAVVGYLVGDFVSDIIKKNKEEEEQK